MARKARTHSDSGVYHVILRGVNKQQIYHKYGRIGHLFQERFKSQPVNDFSYFTTLLRYTHQNPLKAMLIDSIENMNGAAGRNTMEQPIKVFAQHRLFSVAYPLPTLKPLSKLLWQKKMPISSLMLMFVPRSQRIQMKRYGNFSLPYAEPAMPPSFRHFLVHSRSFISLQPMRKASGHEPSHVSQAFHTP